VKYAMDCVGYYGGEPRPPLLPLTEAQKKTVESVLAESIARQKLDHLGVAP
jgi:dihydrodipicolinate synthase/N-acetylneuraminate lyase